MPTFLPASPKLSILLNGPESFKDRKVGVLVSEGVNAGLLSAVKAAAQKEGASVEIVAPTIGGVTASDGSHVSADHKFGGGPSVLFDSVVILVTPDKVDKMASDAAVKDFINDAYAHYKFMGYNDAGAMLLSRVGVKPDSDEALLALKSGGDSTRFIQACRKLRNWSRAAKVKS